MTKREKLDNGFQWYMLDLDIDVALKGGYDNLMQDIENESSTLRILKSTPIFFLNEEDQETVEDIFGNVLKLWLIFNNGKYHVFLNNHIRSYYSLYYLHHSYEQQSDYDVSYPLLRSFETEEEAVKFYNKMKKMTDKVGIKESITKKFNVIEKESFFTDESKRFVDECEFIDIYEKTVYYFNNCQQFAVLLESCDYHSKNGDSYFIIFNRKIKLEFDTERNRENCWDYLINFYGKFEEKNKRISNQLFLPNFLEELTKHSKVEFCCDDEYGRINEIECIYNKNFEIECGVYSVNGGEMEIYFNIWGEKQYLSHINDLENLLDKLPRMKWMEKYF